MGKKIEKGVKEKNQSAAGQDTPDDDPNKTPEPQNFTGNFQVDFTELCRRNGLSMIPSVVPRPRVPPVGTSHTPSEGKPDKNKKGQQPDPDQEVEVTEDGEPVEAPPKTYITKEKYEYFRPCIQVEMENPDKADSVTEVYIRGWKIDEVMMETFQQCWPRMEKLHTVHLWNTGLTGETTCILASFLPQCTSIRNLVLDGNCVKEENFYLLISDESPVQHLSLRHCGMTDKGAEGIGQALGGPTKYNLKLLSLNLTGNKITDTGAEHLARGLRTNRTLLSLSLANNQIQDKGMISLSEVLHRFALTHEEIVERRKIKSDSGSPERLKSPTSSRRADSRDRPASVRSNTHMDKSRRDKSSTLKKKPDAKGGKDVKEDTKGKKAEKDDKGGTKKGAGTASGANAGGRGSGASLVAEAGKTMAGKTKDAKKKKDKGGTPQDLETDVPDHIVALNDEVEPDNGKLFLVGNRVLINLNLSRNNIGEAGVTALLRAIQFQTTIILTQAERRSGTGLMRISVAKNKVNADSEVLKKLAELMVSKDPFYKAPVKTPEEEQPPTKSG